jgi:hypothetical protein
VQAAIRFAGRVLYRCSQKHIIRSLVPNNGRVSQKFDVGLKYFDWLAKHGMWAFGWKDGGRPEVSRGVWAFKRQHLPLDALIPVWHLAARMSEIREQFSLSRATSINRRASKSSFG